MSGFKCWQCYAIVDSMLGDVCNKCRTENKRHKELVDATKPAKLEAERDQLKAELTAAQAEVMRVTRIANDACLADMKTMGELRAEIERLNQRLIDAGEKSCSCNCVIGTDNSGRYCSTCGGSLYQATIREERDQLKLQLESTREVSVAAVKNLHEQLEAAQMKNEFEVWLDAAADKYGSDPLEGCSTEFAANDFSAGAYAALQSPLVLKLVKALEKNMSEWQAVTSNAKNLVAWQVSRDALTAYHAATSKANEEKGGE